MCASDTATTSPQTTERPMRDYPCPHCGGSGEVFIDRLEAAGCPVDLTHACAYCEGRGHFTRPVLPRGAVRAFRVLWDEQGGWDDPDAVAIYQATSAAQAKMHAVRDIREAFAGTPVDFFRHLRVRRAPEHDGLAAHAPEVIER